MVETSERRAPKQQRLPTNLEPWTSRERPSPIPTNADVNRPAPREQGVLGWSVVIGILALAVLGVLIKWSFADG